MKYQAWLFFNNLLLMIFKNDFMIKKLLRKNDMIVSENYKRYLKIMKSDEDIR